MKCSKCQKTICRTKSQIAKSKSGNHFCSSSCSASFFNKLNPKRIAKMKCKTCSEKIRSDSIYCGNCYKKKHFLDDKTLSEATYNKTDNNRYTSIRKAARRIYLKSGRKKCCEECGYSLHFEVCHITDIPKHSPNTLIREINDISNLIALCRNHHWEFGNGHLKVDLEGLEPPTVEL